MIFLNKDYEFSEASFTDTLESIKPIYAQNHAETGIYDMPFNPDYERYIFLEREGNLRFFLAKFQNEIVGFAVFFIDSEIMQKELISATQSATYVAKQHRGLGYPFMKFCDDILKKQGINSVWRQASAKHDIGKVYERMGYTLIEKSYLRRL